MYPLVQFFESSFPLLWFTLYVYQTLLAEILRWSTIVVAISAALYRRLVSVSKTFS